MFPEAATLAEADLAGLGLTRARADAIVALATAVAAGDLDLDTCGDVDATLGRLRALPGVGDWTAQYIAMRALREPDAFPESDLGLRRGFFGSGDPAPAPRLREAAEAWRPWRAYAAMHLWTGGGEGLGQT